MTDGQDLTIVTSWGLGGLVASALAVSVFFPGPLAAPDKVLVERVVHSLSQQSCRHTLHAFADELDSSDRTAWLWAEESVPGDATLVSRTRRAESTAPPRPYAFRPGTERIPQEACSFETNSVHVLSFEAPTQPTVFPMNPAIE